MEKRRQVIEEPFGVSPDRMFKILVSPSAIRSWWGASTCIVDPKKGGSWVAAWGENERDSDNINSYSILEFEPPIRMLLGSSKYFGGSNWPIKTSMTTEFIIEPGPAGCNLRIVQELSPADPLLDDFFDDCVLGWQSRLDSITNDLHNTPTV